MNPLAIKVTICAIIGLGVFLVGYKAGSLSGDVEVSALKEKTAQEQAAAAILLSQEVLANELIKAKLAAATSHSLDVVSAAAHNIPVGVQLPATLCADYGQADTSSGSQPTVEGSGALFKSVEGILSTDRSRVIGIVTEAEVELAFCREVKEWAKGDK